MIHDAWSNLQNGRIDKATSCQQTGKSHPLQKFRLQTRSKWAKREISNGSTIENEEMFQTYIFHRVHRQAQ